eukprot:5229533-Pleurochrysis_carterae.AAC.7
MIYNEIKYTHTRTNKCWEAYFCLHFRCPALPSICPNAQRFLHNGYCAVRCFGAFMLCEFFTPEILFAVGQVIVATDHEGIASLVRADGEGAIAVMTDSRLASGTDRIEAAVRALGFEADIIVNVQGDEPLIQPSAINLAARLLQDCDRADMSTLAAPLPPSALLDINKVKLVCREVLTSGNEQLSPRQLMALYFSRAPIGVERSALQQALRESARGDDSAGAVAAATEHACELHVGVYGYRASTLRRFVQLPPSRLERLEKLEQMRAVEAGMHIAVGRIQCAPHNVDTEEDLLAVSSILKAEASGTPLSRDQPRRYPVLS